MHLGEPIKTITCEPKQIPVPEWQPEREPISIPQEEPRELPQQVPADK